MSSNLSWWRGQEGKEPPRPGVEVPDIEPTLSLPEDAPTEKPLTRRIHLLGLGSIGTFIAHSLMCLPNPPPMSLLFHRQEMYNDFNKKTGALRLINHKTQINDERRGFDVELAETDPDTKDTFWRFKPYQERGKSLSSLAEDATLGSGENYIHTLIITVKGPATVTALRSVKHRINAETTICLIQNGMGQLDQLNREVFTDPKTRPTYMLGIISHGVHLASNFVAIHAGFGTVALGVVRDLDKFPLPPRTLSPSVSNSGLSDADRKRMYPTDTDLYANISSRYLLRTLTRSPILACATFPYLDLLQLQLEKLAMNAVLNPITALLDVPNGAMLYNVFLTRVQRLLLAEISLVLRALPELEGVPNVRMRFSPERLETLAVGIAAKTAENSSSMREDVRKARLTEIEYINGYVVKRGEEQGVKCVLNYMIMQLVLGKTWATKSAEGESLPYGVSRVEGKMMDPRVAKEGSVMLEDKGTPAHGRRF